MGEAEDLPFHASLAIRDDRVEASTELFDDDARVHALRRANSGHRGARRTRKELKAKLLHGFASGASEQLRICDELIHADRLNVLQRFSKGQQERGIRCPGRLTTRSILPLAFEIEVISRGLRSFRSGPSLF